MDKVVLSGLYHSSSSSWTGTCEAFTQATGTFESFGDRGGNDGYKGFGRCKCNADHEGEACEHSKYQLVLIAHIPDACLLQRNVQHLTHKFVAELSEESANKRPEDAYVIQDIGTWIVPKVGVRPH